jgi:peptidoglycan/xylan/chitin deacetylase (PgdA/CDA1 family)
MDTQQPNAFNLAELSDQISLLKMDWLTSIGQSILPPGYWGEELKQASAEETKASGVSSPAKTIYLTFDDGPNPYSTRQLLELLEEEKVPATFFLIGSHIDRHPDIARLPLLKNHTVGSHSYSHMYLPLLGSKSIENEVVRTNVAIEQAVGVKPKVFRPPYGVINKRAADCLIEHQMKLVYWGAVPEDWRVIGSERIAQRVAQRLAHGKMIVLHEGQRIADQTVLATKKIIDRARAEGFEFRAL